MSTVFYLSNAKLFTSYKIISCKLEQTAKLRFAQMGLYAGSVVKVLKVAPLGDPMEIEVLGYKLCIRISHAQQFEICEVNQ